MKAVDLDPSSHHLSKPAPNTQGVGSATREEKATHLFPSSAEPGSELCCPRRGALDSWEAKLLSAFTFYFLPVTMWPLHVGHRAVWGGQRTTRGSVCSPLIDHVYPRGRAQLSRLVSTYLSSHTKSSHQPHIYSLVTQSALVFSGLCLGK